MQLPSIAPSLPRRTFWLLAIAVVLTTGFLSALAARPDEPASDSVGIIDGAAIAVSGPMKVEVVKGFARTVLRSGSDVRVKYGTARLDLVEGGVISICGPAHFSVLKSGKLLTVALETGSIHAYVEHDPALTIYTPQIQAQTVAIGDNPQDVLVGYDVAGTMCIRANRGAVRVEQQLTGQSVLIPQSGNVSLLNGQLDSMRAGGEQCSCDPQISKSAPLPPLEVSPQPASQEALAGPPEPPQPNAPSASVDGAGTKDQPIYEVVMPPLIYEANSKEQPEPDPSMIVLIRRVRVRPTLIFQGRVQGEVAAPPPAHAPAPAPAPTKPSAASPQKPAAAANDSVVDRVRNFVRKLWSRGS